MTGVFADVILPAAGSSVRMNAHVAKQFQEVCGHPILAYTIDCFHRLSIIRHIVVVVEASQLKYTHSLMHRYKFDRVKVSTGGSTRHRSIYAGVQALLDVCSSSDVVLIHDAARPFVPEDIIFNIVNAASKYKAAGVTRPLVSTVIRGDSEANLTESLDRRFYRNSEMPQAFHHGVILNAYRQCTDYDFDFGTECLLLALKYSDCPAHLLEGSDDLWKVTYKKDFYAMESIVKEKLTVISVTDTCEALPGTDLKIKLHASQFQMASADVGGANTHLVFVRDSHLDQADIDGITSQLCKHHNSLSSRSNVCLHPYVLIIFVDNSNPPAKQGLCHDSDTCPSVVQSSDCKEEGQLSDVDTNSKSTPAELDTWSDTSHRRHHHLESLHRIKVLLLNKTNMKSLCVLGVCAKLNSDDLVERLLRVIWDRAAYLDGQLIEWT